MASTAMGSESEHEAFKVGEGQERVPDFEVELPGFPILGSGMGDSQSTAIIFSRGSSVQAMDMNRGQCREQVPLPPCALGELRENSQMIVGFPRCADFREDEYASAKHLFEKYGAPTCAAFVGSEALRGEGERQEADRGNTHPDQEKEARYFSCRVTRDCEVGGGWRRLPDFRVDLPGFPIQGKGEGDNQSSAVIFSRCLCIQAMDMNRGGYLEQMPLLPRALGEFRENSQMIVGFPEHTASDLGSVGEFAASAETVFGTMMQRVYAFMGARTHYGRPDIMSKVWVTQQGGVPKATQTVNLSEDIFAGMDFTLRGRELRGQAALPEHAADRLPVYALMQQVRNMVWVMRMRELGASKATRAVNLSEDILAGMVLTLRGMELCGRAPLPEHAGRIIKQAEYPHLGKHVSARRPSRREAKPPSSWPRRMLPGRPSRAAGPRGARGR